LADYFTPKQKTTYKRFKFHKATQLLENQLKTQIQKTIRKCNSQLYLLLRIKQYLDLQSRKLFFNAYILPHLDYCCTIWGHCSSELLSQIIKFQKRAAKIVLDKSFDSPSNVLFKGLNWMSFDQRIMYKKAILMYKSINEPSFPNCMKNKFQMINDKHNFNLRSVQNEKLVIPKPTTEYFRKSLTILVLKYGMTSQFIFEIQILWRNFKPHILSGNFLIKWVYILL
jgi:hypothetical protein